MVDIPKTCKAVVIMDYEKPLEIHDVKIPQTLEPGAILVKTAMASICGSDIHLWLGHFRTRRPIHPPNIPGHEMTGHDYLREANVW